MKLSQDEKEFIMLVVNSLSINPDYNFGKCTKIAESLVVHIKERIDEYLDSNINLTYTDTSFLDIIKLYISIREQEAKLKKLEGELSI